MGNAGPVRRRRPSQSGKNGPGAGMVADPAKANEQAAPIAPNVASANTVFRIESLRCLRRGDDSRVAARQKEADSLPHAEN